MGLSWAVLMRGCRQLPLGTLRLGFIQRPLLHVPSRWEPQWGLSAGMPSGGLSERPRLPYGPTAE